ncbi:MAG: tRNA uridine(34) 5-carboxymethylaminomethyl modification radical SAM/GNAT enzyme Elp3 [Eggerthellaceae bacterium]|nr:tRNA uridine(34) 5-carboxymethylaminomethyl modification radical SAM/GNAT enzyme Elp3 [Eggerthellaceae bacterium]
MQQLMADIIAELKDAGTLSARKIDRIIAVHNRRFRDPVKHFAKKHLAPYYLQVKQNDPALWESWELSEAQERALLAAIQMKPRRTASGVATITVITKPHACTGNCIYCPNDVRMPKSYLHAEPACQRAERNYFDPYLQVASRLAALERMGHATDKVELIVLGGSFTDYPHEYQMWFMREMFCALNDAEVGLDDVGDVFEGARVTSDVSCVAKKQTPSPSALASGVTLRMQAYAQAGLSNKEEKLAMQTSAWQARVSAREASYNDAVEALYGAGTAWEALSQKQVASLDEVQGAQSINEGAAHRVVGLVVETRPDAINTDSLTLLRRLGCTKLQMGVQTLDEQVAASCQRPTPLTRVRDAFELARAFGFKSHAHFMANLPGATPEGDRKDYQSFVKDCAIAPDEVKLYPCVLIDDTELVTWHSKGAWQPYPEQILVDILATDVLTTPPYTRISRMIRDFSSGDIVAGNKKTNLRQMVEQRVKELVSEGATPVQEIRMREIATSEADAKDLLMQEISYNTSNTQEVFLQWVLPAADGSAVENHIAGFLRLSLPSKDWIEAHAEHVPVHTDEAMIREVHIYGAAARLHAPTRGAQHQGLGRALVERACEIAREAGYSKINVISAVGTRNYYRRLGFCDNGLYLSRVLS